MSDVQRSSDEHLTVFEKARRMGLDERQIEKAQQPMTHVIGQQLETHEAMDRVLIYAKAYDNPGKTVSLPWLGIGYVPHGDGAATIWRRVK